jgi:MFS family permease
MCAAASAHRPDLVSSAAHSGHSSAGSQPDARPVLYTLPFIAVCVVALLGFGQSFMLQPVLPLLVLHLGGDAAVVGLVFAVYSIPSILLRPVVGQLADRWGFERVLLFGTVGIAIMAPLYLIPSIAAILVVRVAHGIVWASFSTGGTSLLARIAPARRRVEASGVYDLMPAIASLVMPSIGLLLLGAVGFAGPFGLAAALAACAALVTLVVFRPDRARVQSRPRPAGGARYLEPSAVLPMLTMLLFTSVSSLFVAYPPLLAHDRGIPVADLALYYPAYGIVLVVARLFTRRLEGVVPSRLIAAAAVIAALSAVLGAFADSLASLTVAAMIFAIGNGIAPPAAQASVMENAPRDRLGGAMGTYTLGFQVGTGLGAAVWGGLVGPVGFTGAFLIAAIIQVGLIGLTVLKRASLDGVAASAA